MIQQITVIQAWSIPQNSSCSFSRSRDLLEDINRISDFHDLSLLLGNTVLPNYVLPKVYLETSQKLLVIICMKRGTKFVLLKFSSYLPLLFLSRAQNFIRPYFRKGLVWLGSCNASLLVDWRNLKNGWKKQAFECAYIVKHVKTQLFLMNLW